MSDENNQVSDQGNNISSASTEKDQFVHKKAFEDVSKDMHKFKAKLKDKEAYIAELEAKQTAIEEAALVESQQYKALFEKRNDEFERLKQEVDDRDRKYLEAVKKNALKNELGGSIKEEYLMHADMSSIQFSEGSTIDRDSLTAVANSFRQKYPELVPVIHSSNITGPSSPSNTTAGQTTLKPLSQLTIQEKKTLLASPELMNQYKAKGLL